VRRNDRDVFAGARAKAKVLPLIEETSGDGEAQGSAER
jgi:hypothetical protein